MISMRDLSRQLVAALRLLLVMTVLLGLLYPAAVWAVGRAVPDRADGSLVRVDGEVVGSRLLGQSFPGNQWFHARPSAVQWDALASGPSNLGPSNPELVKAIEERRMVVARTEGVPPGQVPPDAVTTSGSGLDPHISPAYAALQVPRVARERGLSKATVRGLVADATRGRSLGFLGEPTVNVLELNVALQGAD